MSATSGPTTSPEEPPAPHDQEVADDIDLGYQPALDGIRGLVLLTVLAAHMLVFFPRLAELSSWIAVDQFFVLSGFLITTLLLREFTATGTMSLRSFYVRRIARLYPLIAAMCVVSIVLVLFVPVHGIQPSWLGVASIAFYFSNWAVIVTHNWQILGGFSQVWSLAIEEQFYLVWPPILAVILALGGRRRAIIAVLGTALVAMVAYRRHVWLGWVAEATNHPNMADLAARRQTVWDAIYLGSHTRPDGLLVGCLLAAAIGFRPTRPGKVVRGIVAAAGMAGFAFSVVLFVQTEVNGAPVYVFNWGLFAFNVGTAVMMLHLLYNPRSILGRFYGMWPLVWVGQRSYGFYVIHLIVYLTFLHNDWVSPLGAVIANVFVLVIGGLSYRYYEMPCRLMLNHRFGGGSPRRPGAPTPAGRV